MTDAICRLMEQAFVSEENPGTCKLCGESIYSIVENICAGIAVIGMDGSVLLINRELERMLGCSRDDLLGMNLFGAGLISESEESRIRSEMLPRLIKNGFLRTYEATLKGKDGSSVSVLINSILLKDPETRTAGVFCTITGLSSLNNKIFEVSSATDRDSLIVENSPYAIIIHQHSIINFVNNAASVLSGFKKEEIIGQSMNEFICTNYHDVMSRQFCERDTDNRRSAVNETQIIRKDGSLLPVEVNSTLFFDNREAYSLVFLRDISEKKIIENQLKISEHRYRTFIEQSSEGIWRLDFSEAVDTNLPTTLQIEKFYDNGYLGECNDVMARMYGFFLAEDIVGSGLITLHGGRNNVLNIESQKAFIESGYRTIDIETEEIDKHGNKSYFLNNAVGTVRDGKLIYIWGTQRDITKLKLAKREITHALHEKDILLKEIHHRVKNNLQVIISLLRLQSRYLVDPRDVELYRDCENRIRSMAIIHEKLYRSADLSRISLKTYIDDLSRYLLRSYQMPSEAFLFSNGIEEIFLEIEDAVPFGLVINELLSNAIKHAFTPSWKGEKRIGVRCCRKDGMLLLSFSDNGIGLPEDIEIGHAQSLGLHLVHIIVTEQLNGAVHILREKGTRFDISFPFSY